MAFIEDLLIRGFLIDLNSEIEVHLILASLGYLRHEVRHVHNLHHRIVNRKRTIRFQVRSQNMHVPFRHLLRDLSCETSLINNVAGGTTCVFTMGQCINKLILVHNSLRLRN